jgi:toxin YoeB
MSIYFADNIAVKMLQMSADNRLRKRLERLIAELERDPYSTFAKAELLKGDRAGQRSMRIDDYHRLIYRIGENNEVTIIECGEHYEG